MQAEDKKEELVSDYASPDVTKPNKNSQADMEKLASMKTDKTYTDYLMKGNLQEEKRTGSPSYID